MVDILVTAEQQLIEKCVVYCMLDKVLGQKHGNSGLNLRGINKRGLGGKEEASPKVDSDLHSPVNGFRDGMVTPSLATTNTTTPIMDADDF